MENSRIADISEMPGMAALSRLRSELSLTKKAETIYLVYGRGPSGLELTGFLVSCAGDIDRVIAYCPLDRRFEFRSLKWCEEVGRQLRIAARVAEDPVSARRACDLIWLGYVEFSEREVPQWVYAMACVPLNGRWDGNLLTPRPFCPSLFQRMASQPQAARWLERCRSALLATTGDSDRNPISTNVF